MFTLLQHVASRLHQAEIPYMLTGSMAMSFYAAPRATQDIDIVLELLPSNIEAFLAVFPPGQFYIDPQDIRAQMNRKGRFNLIDLQTYSRIDGIVRNDTEYERVKFDRRQLKEMEGTMYHVIALEDLILAKLQWIQQYYSEKQMEDIKALMAQGGADLVYIRHWASNLHLNTFALWP